MLHFIAGRRLAQPRLTVVDATNVQRESRRPLVNLAKEHDLFPVAIVLDPPEEVCQARNRARPDRDFGPHVVRQQRAQLRRSLKGLQKEGFRRVWVLRADEEVEVTSARRCGPTAASSTARSTSSATSTAAPTSWSRCCASSATSVDGTTVTPPPGRKRGVRRRLRATAARTRRPS